MVLSAGCSLLRAEGFFCNLYVLYGGLGIGKLKILIPKKKFSAVNFFQLLVIKTVDPDRYSAENAGSRSVSNEYGSETLGGK